MSAKVTPAIIVIFGATGDLAHRKLIPSLYEMAEAGQMHAKTIILGVGRDAHSDTDFRKTCNESIQEFIGRDTVGAEEWCGSRIFYQSIGENALQDYKSLSARIAKLEHSHSHEGNRILYLALPPPMFGPTIDLLGEAGLNKSKGWTRLVIEKPFGRDLQSAKELNEIVHKHFAEEQVYRIDHYLGKETVQNLVAFRFGNALFESVWNREKIEKVEIVVAEELGVESRAGYYEKSGAMRDMVQNHLTQLLALTAMEIPASFTAADIRYEKVRVLRSIAPIGENDVIFGQYTEGEIGTDKVRGYREEKGVRANSKTETFVELKLRVENWRWHGVPFYLKTGKRLKGHSSEIIVTFRCPPISLFTPRKPHPEDGHICSSANVLIIALQPNEGFRMSFEVKAPGTEMMLKTEWMHFSYLEAFGPLPDAYHTLLYDVMLGDQTLFVSSDEMLASWKLYTPVLKKKHELHMYPAGSWGPEFN